jgi:rhodanese-related sulfurtransferase
MKLIFIILGIVTLAIIPLSGCSQESQTLPQGQEVKVDGGSYWNITPAQLEEMLKTKDFPFVNVHIPYNGEIPETDLFVPYDQIEPNISKFPENKAAKIVLYCRSGSMSAVSAETLVGLGFTNVWNLDGGMVEWEGQGYELIQ